MDSPPSPSDPDEMEGKGTVDAPSQAANTETSLVEIPTEKEESTKGPSLGNYIRILSYGARQGGTVAMVLGLVCAMGSGVALPLMNIVFGNQVGSFNQYSTPGNTLAEDSFKHTIDRNSLYIVYLFIGKFVLTYISMLSFRLISLRASADLRLEYLEALFSLPVSTLDEISSGTVTHAITSLSNQIQQSVSDKLSMLFQSLALLVAAYAIAFRYSWALTLVVSAAILFVLLGFSITVPFFVKSQHRVDEADQKHASIAADVLASIRTVFSLGAEQSLGMKYSSWIDEAKRRGARMSIVSGIHLGILFFAMYVSFGLAFWFGLKLFREGHIGNINTVITVFFSVLLVVTVLGNIASPLMIISKAISASRPFFNIIDARQPDATGLTDLSSTREPDIVFGNVSFAYPSRPTAPVLRNFHARFKHGKTTALVGPSGSGKSTIVALLQQWYNLETSDNGSEKEVSGGRIQVGGLDINSLDPHWWRTQIGLVQQEPFLFNTTVLGNITMGLTGTEWENSAEAIKMELVVRASKEAYADDFIQKLPQGYETLVGEGGIHLSGGQRQRIAIARCIIRRPPFLILDEATSAMDVHSEQIVQAALERMVENRTTILIAHRLSTVRKADHLIVMKDGSNAEEGSHEDLMAAGGLYHSLVHAQRLGSLSPSDSGIYEAKDGRCPIPVDAVDDQVTTSNTVAEYEGNGDYSAMEVDSDIQKHKRASTRVLFQILQQQRKYWPLYLLTLVGGVGASSGFALQSWLFAQIVQAFQYTGQKLIDAGNFWALMFFILALAMAAFYLLVGYCSNRISLIVASEYRQEYFHSMLAQPVPWFDREENNSGALTSRLSTDPRQLQELFGVSGVFPLISILSVIGCIAISFSFGPKLAAVAFCAGTPFMFLGAYARIRYEMKFEALNAEVYAESSQFASEAIRAFRTVTSLTLEKPILRRYEALVSQQRRRAMQKAWYATLLFSFADSFELCSMALTLWYGGQLLASHEYDVVTFLVVYVAIIQGGQSAGQFLSFGPNIAQAAASAQRILGLRSRAEPNSTSLDSLPFPPENHYPGIQLQNITFTYSTLSMPVLCDLSLEIQPGQFVALVGASGCGKSTIISLLERFYRVCGGQILFGGQSIDSFDLSMYRASLALVSQEPKLFEGTIRDNLLLGQSEVDAATESNMVQACRDAEIHDFIVSLPDGYNTALGVNAQAALSGGQKQRICIARALIRKPCLLLLDEATSSLDSQSEMLVQRAMERLAKKREMTIITVAHRLATVQKADRIFVLGRGQGDQKQSSQLLEEGTHEELLHKRGVYWEMSNAWLPNLAAIIVPSTSNYERRDRYPSRSLYYLSSRHARITVGGGVGGLTLALGLPHRNIPVQIYERSEGIAETGLGLSIGPAAARITPLIDPRLSSLYDPILTTPRDNPGYEQFQHTWFEYVSTKSGEVFPEIEKVKEHIFGLGHPFSPVYSGCYAYRATLDMNTVVEAVGDRRARVATKYQGDGAYCVTYPIMRYTTVNVGFFKIKEWKGDAWVVPATKDQMREDFQHIVGQVNALLEISILGDAAHAAPPRNGSGAGQAIEYAHVLCELMSDPRVTRSPQAIAALQAYDAVRRPRSQRVVAHRKSRATLLFFRAPGIGCDEDRVKDHLADGLDWIWDSDVEEQVERARADRFARINALP